MISELNFRFLKRKKLSTLFELINTFDSLKDDKRVRTFDIKDVSISSQLMNFSKVHFEITSTLPRNSNINTFGLPGVQFPVEVMISPEVS